MKQMGSPHSGCYGERRIECLYDYSQKKKNDNFQKIMLSHRLRRIRNEHFWLQYWKLFQWYRMWSSCLRTWLICITFSSYNTWERKTGKMMPEFTGGNYSVNACWLQPFRTTESIVVMHYNLLCPCTKHVWALLFPPLSLTLAPLLYFPATIYEFSKVWRVNLPLAFWRGNLHIWHNLRNNGRNPSVQNNVHILSFQEVSNFIKKK